MIKYIVIEIGCIECGVSTKVKGMYDTKLKAEAVAGKCKTWREGGQSEPKVFKIKIK